MINDSIKKDWTIYCRSYKPTHTHTHSLSSILCSHIPGKSPILKLVLSLWDPVLKLTRMTSYGYFKKSLLDWTLIGASQKQGHVLHLQ